MLGGSPHATIGSDPGSNDPRFSGSGGGDGAGSLALLALVITVLLGGLILLEMFAPWWAFFIVLGICVIALASVLFTVFSKERGRTL